MLWGRWFAEQKEYNTRRSRDSSGKAKGPVLQVWRIGKRKKVIIKLELKTKSYNVPKFTKKISFYKVQFKTAETYKMGDLLESELIIERDFRIQGKMVHYRLIEKTGNFIIGIIETDRNHSIPPKKNKRTKIKSNLGLLPDESLVYGNVFLYDKKSEILMYEINKNGCSAEHFILYIYKACKTSDVIFKNFDMQLLPVLNGGEYDRLISMPFLKSIEIEVAKPTELLEAYKHKHGALIKILSSSKNLKAQKTYLKYDVTLSKKKGAINEGLNEEDVIKLVDEIIEIKNSENGEYIEDLQIIGYEDEESTLSRIDLFADLFSGKIELDEPLQHDNLLEDQRQKKIRDLYFEVQPRLKKIFK